VIGARRRAVEVDGKAFGGLADDTVSMLERIGQPQNDSVMP
jgi:hypothetical protein